jgi:hypothetical protein
MGCRPLPCGKCGVTGMAAPCFSGAAADDDRFCGDLFDPPEALTGHGGQLTGGWPLILVLALTITESSAAPACTRL